MVRVQYAAMRLIILYLIISMATGIDYPGGWIPSTNQCVNICNSGSRSSASTNSQRRVCYDPPTPACESKQNEMDDYDYLLLEQLYVPQFCLDLLNGIDFTMSHQNVNPYPKGIRCLRSNIHPKFTIHGLWPNYFDGFPTCCDVSSTYHNKPFDPQTLADSNPELIMEMSNQWIDPTQSNSFDSLCQIYNHEFQKHGICYQKKSVSLDDWSFDNMAMIYFRDTLNVARNISTATKQLNDWAQDSTNDNQKGIRIQHIQELYPKTISILCSTTAVFQEETKYNQIAAIRTCWSKHELKLMDCPDAPSFGPLIPCHENEMVYFASYVELSFGETG